ncbi:hypothetical protein BN1080_00828 [Planococcus massiliensis]|uniref:Uncharacterized protein n=1 Tax=Planococcus massiliensis TaxID=1499687 RepID=A0A098EI11_9BACL|nr:hypothetical protein [Planococcus massiliensis]CEG21908.1 hypothetical protein BN1080_00828 [Planococcus massiliensis]
MRNGIELDGWVITTDNSAGIGCKELDVVKAPDQLAAKFAARVALLEQWAAGSEPEAVLVHNFSGDAQWLAYKAGIEEIFQEAEMAVPQIGGSSETNMATLQSGIAVTMLGRQQRFVLSEPLQWFVYGKPLVGKAVLEQKKAVADLKKIRTAIRSGLAERIWPIGSKGIAAEARKLFGETASLSADIDLAASAGPACCVLLGVKKDWVKETERFFGEFLEPLIIEKEEGSV